MEWVYLSPHFDDVSFSCGGLVWEQAQTGMQVSVWTICAGDPLPGPLPPFAEKLHARWDIGQAAVRERRAEDKASCQVLGAVAQHFNIPDCIYRRSAVDGLPYYPDEGDIFGIRAILRNDVYRLKASAIEESIIYALPASEFLRIIQDNIDVHKYLATTFASNLAIEGNHPDLPEIKDYNISTFQKVSYSTPVITCSPNHSVAEAAKLMTVHKVGSVIITNSQNHPKFLGTF